MKILERTFPFFFFFFLRLSVNEGKKRKKSSASKKDGKTEGVASAALVRSPRERFALSEDAVRVVVLRDSLDRESFDFRSIFLPHLTVTGKFTTPRPRASTRCAHARGAHARSPSSFPSTAGDCFLLFSHRSSPGARASYPHRSRLARPVRRAVGEVGCRREAERAGRVAAKRKHRIITTPDLEQYRRVSRLPELGQEFSCRFTFFLLHFARV